MYGILVVAIVVMEFIIFQDAIPREYLKNK